MSERLKALADAGVSIWLDDLSRERIETGNLADLVKNSTSSASPPTRRSSPRRSPTASGTTTRSASSRAPGSDVDEAIFAITTDDVRYACDVLRATYDATDGVDGRVSIEVAPRPGPRHRGDRRRGQAAVAAGRPAQPVHQDPGHHEGLPGDHRRARPRASASTSR